MVPETNPPSVSQPASAVGCVVQKGKESAAAPTTRPSSDDVNLPKKNSIQTTSPNVSVTSPKVNVANPTTATTQPPHKQPPLPPSKPNTPKDPLLHVAIILQRPPTHDPTAPFSWGFSMIQQTPHAYVVDIKSSPNSPVVKFCRVSNFPPPSCAVYSQGQQQQQYEANLIKSFPPNFKSCSSITTPRLQLGDAIISVNGIAISSFESIQAVASYIRQYCKQKLIIVALRHYNVWKAAWSEAARKIKVKIPMNKTIAQLQLENAAKEKSERVSRCIKQEWGKLKNPAKRKLNMHHPQSKKIKLTPLFDRYSLADTRQLTNPMFSTKNKEVMYCDNDEVDPDDGRRFRLFCSSEMKVSFHDWLRVRKVTWRSRRRHVPGGNNCNDAEDNEPSLVSHEFWLANGYSSFDDWLTASKAQWRRSYSWHKDRKMKLQSETEKEVHFPSTGLITSQVPTDETLAQFHDWLAVRKQQWRITRRKRQLSRADIVVEDKHTAQDASSTDDSVEPKPHQHIDQKSRRRVSSSNDTMIIDELLEDQKRQARRLDIDHAPLNISWLFDSDVGAPDDVITLLMRFLNPSDHGNLLCLSWTSNYSFKLRDAVWQSLCPQHWVLPRRPRKSWCVMYISRIRAEEEASRKQSDDLLTKADSIIDKGDLLTKFEKLVLKGQKDFAFDVNYTSGTVLERNSLLNMAVIGQRKNIVKWLVEEKHSDIETCDRGNFTPLLNAAWNGDKYLVRYLLGKGADRKKIGTFHSSKGLASKEFEGMNAEGWARERGHLDVADLIHIGL